MKGHLRHVAMASAAFLILLEIICRVIFPLPEVAGFNRGLYEVSEETVSLSNLILEYPSAPDGVDTTYRVNMYGFRGDDFSIRPAEGQRRIVFFGDSYVEGNGVLDDDTIPKLFSDKFKSDQHTEILNLGVSGIGIPELELLLRDAVPLLRPSDSVIVFCWNDLPIFRPRPEGSQIARSFTKLNSRHPRFFWAASRAWRGESLPLSWYQGPFPFFMPTDIIQLERSNGIDLSKADPEIRQAIEQGKCNPMVASFRHLFRGVIGKDLASDPSLRRSITRMIEYCRRGNSRPVVAFIPIHFLVNEEYHLAHDRLLPSLGARDISASNPECFVQQRFFSSLCEELGVPFLDMTMPLSKGEREGKRTCFPIDGHCTPAGTAIIAEEIFNRCFAEPNPKRALDQSGR